MATFFNDAKIIPTRLYSFSSDSLSKFTKANSSGQYDDTIALITAPIGALGDELGIVDTSLNIQKGATQTNSQVLTSFSSTMSEQEPFIAAALGGRNSSLFLQFYPHKISEYSQATKLQMPTLTSRVFTAAAANAAVLGVPLTDLLQGFKKQWANSRDDQQQQMGDVKGNRSERGTALTAVQKAMLTAVHTVAAMFPGDVTQSSALFNFTLLFAVAHHKHETFSGTIAPGQTVIVFNRALTENTGITIRNTTDNADISAWLSPDGKSAMPEDALSIQSINSASPKLHELGDLENTFFMITNMSAVNSATYEVETVGLKEEEA